jgi:hypothetical protein
MVTDGTGGVTYVSSQVAKVSTIAAQTGEAFSLYDLPHWTRVVGLWFLTENTGYDYASVKTPHGVIRNFRSTSTTDGTSMLLKNNFQPTFVPDRYSVGLVTSGYLSDNFEDEADNCIAYQPANPNIKARVFTTKNATLIDSLGNTFQFSDAYHTAQKQVGKVRGFCYGSALYLHNQYNQYRFDGNSIKGNDILHPGVPMVAVKSNGSSGLNGTFEYAYTYKCEDGTESYPSIFTSVTVKTGKVSLYLPSNISTYSYVNDRVRYVNIYRNKGQTTSVSLGRDADKSFYLLKEIPIQKVRQSSTPFLGTTSTVTTGTVLFVDTTADTALGGNPPAPGSADTMPACQYSCVFKDTGFFTGNESAPNYYYQSMAENPSLLNLAEEFRTENGETNTGVASCGFGVIIFKPNARKLLRNGIGGETYEYANGGAMSHDSLCNWGNYVLGLGSSGFFMSDGHNYTDITTVNANGRQVSGCQKDVDSWSDAVKSAARSVFDSATGRYICYVNSKYYIYDTKQKVWTKYEDLVGVPVVFNNILYFFKKGFLYAETDSQNYFGPSMHRKSISAGGEGWIDVTSTTALPTTNTYGLPCYIDRTLYWTTKIKDGLSTSYRVSLGTTHNFNGHSRMTLGVAQNYAYSKFFETALPNCNKWYERMLFSHDQTPNGTLDIIVARNGETQDNAYAWETVYTEYSDKNLIRLRHRADNLSVGWFSDDGLSHRLKNYTMWYRQDSEV